MGGRAAMTSSRRRLILVCAVGIALLVLLLGFGETGGLILVLGGIALAAGLISFFFLWRHYRLIWWICSALLAVIIGAVALSEPAGGGFMPGLGRFVLLYGVLVPILVGWLAGAGYQQFHGRKLRATRETKDHET